MQHVEFSCNQNHHAKMRNRHFFYYYLNLNLVLGTLMRNPTKKKNSCGEPKHLDVNYISIIKLPV